MSESTSPLRPVPSTPPASRPPCDAPKFVNRGQQQPATPRRIRDGVKVRLRAPDQADNWLAEIWQRAMQTFWPVATVAEAWEYARLGQVALPRIDDRGVVALVQGAAYRPFTTRVLVPRLATEAQQQLATRMSQRASLVASLISNELPTRQSLEDLLLAAGVGWIGPSPVFAVECGCRSAADRGACSHSAAVALHVLEWLNREPLLAFDMHGIDRAELVDQLRHARAAQTPGAAAAHADALPAQLQRTPEPLESCIDEFWRCGPTWAAVRDADAPTYAPHALLRRLGPSPLGGRFPLVGLLESIYTTVAQDARSLHDATEPGEPKSGADDR
jgi:uncharacterized Zn finger protein